MRKITFVFLFLALANCTSTPKTTGEITDVGIWQGKVLMTNKKTKQKKWANVTWASDSQANRMRIDVFAAFVDVPIATFLQDKKRSHLWLFTEKTYYTSSSSEKLFSHLTKIDLDPNVFFNLLGEPQSPGPQWQCLEESKVLRCASSQTKIKFSVMHEDPDQRTIKINKPAEALKLRLSRSKVEVKDDQFKPLSTSHFKTIEI